MLFGLRIAPSTFSQTLHVALWTVSWQIALEYLDSTLRQYSPAAEHIAHVEHEQSFSLDAWVTLNLKICSFYAKNID